MLYSTTVDGEPIEKRNKKGKKPKLDDIQEEVKLEIPVADKPDTDIPPSIPEELQVTPKMPELPIPKDDAVVEEKPELSTESPSLKDVLESQKRQSDEPPAWFTAYVKKSKKTPREKKPVEETPNDIRYQRINDQAHRHINQMQSLYQQMFKR